jgi:hypothetical protein
LLSWKHSPVPGEGQVWLMPWGTSSCRCDSRCHIDSMACWGATLNMAGHLVSTVNLQQISLVEQLTSTHIPKEHLSQEYHYYSAKPGPGGARKWSHLTVWVPPCFTPHFPCPGPLPSFWGRPEVLRVWCDYKLWVFSMS